jgi:hypothetical protein
LARTLGVNHNTTTGPHVKTSTWTQMIAATSFDATLVIITVAGNNVANTDSSTLLDIGIGAAASETAIIPDLCAGWVASGNVTPGARHYIFPLYVPSGSRISARTQSVRVTGSVTVFVELFGGPRNPDAWWYGQQVTAYGANAANSAGTKFTPGDTGAEGTGVTVGTTTSDHECLVLGVQGHPDDASWAARGYHFDVGIGSSSTEWTEPDRFYAQSIAAECLGVTGNVWWPIYRPVPSGTELMVRGEASNTADALSAVIYGVS